MPSSGPLVTSAGRDHVILSKQFAIVVVTMLACAAVIFVRVEQGAVKQSIKSIGHIKEQNSDLAARNAELATVKKQLQQDEEELTKMYEKWLEDDSAKMQVTKTAIQELQSKIDAVKKSQAAHASVLDDK